MPATTDYNPIVQTFNRYRTALCEMGGLNREGVRPDARLDTLIPRERRREVWLALQVAGLRTPALRLPPGVFAAWTLIVVAVLGILWLFVGHVGIVAIAALPVWSFANLASRPWSVEIEPCVRTIGDLTLFGTHFHHHADSGYTWSHGDIAHKVRIIIADQLGLPLESVRRDTTFAELEG